MIRDDADFLPVDYDRVIQNTKKSKGLNLNNIIDFLKEQGVNESTIHLVETQCSSKGSETTDTCDEPSSVQNAKEKQSSSGCTDESQPIQESVNGSPVLISDSQQGRALNLHSKDSALATATA